MLEAFFPPGTVVQLKSGGPFITVAGTNKAGIVEGVYFNTVSGRFDVFESPQACLRGANAAPQVPEDARALRNQTVAKSSMSS